MGVVAFVVGVPVFGVTVGVGCDNAMVNNNVALFGEVRLAALLAKVTTLDAGAMTPVDALAMATSDAATAIGRDGDLGVIAVNRKADLVLLDRLGPHWVPCSARRAAPTAGCLGEGVAILS